MVCDGISAGSDRKISIEQGLSKAVGRSLQLKEQWPPHMHVARHITRRSHLLGFACSSSDEIERREKFTV
jgi:hypothetical protein